MTPQEACTAAAEYIAEQGHTKNGKFYEEGVGYCAIGALAAVTGAEVEDGLWGEGVLPPSTGMWIQWNHPLFEQATALLKTHLGVRHDYAIPEWNDDEASTEEVILALKRAGHGD